MHAFSADSAGEFEIAVLECVENDDVGSVHDGAGDQVLQALSVAPDTGDDEGQSRYRSANPPTSTSSDPWLDGPS